MSLAIVLFGLTLPTSAQEANADREQGARAWEKVFEVLSHPRCSNCHVGSSGVPVWSGPSFGDNPRQHGMNIRSGESRIGAEGLPCNTCHGLRNIDLPHAAPGAEGWRLPPPEFEWFGKASNDVCQQVRDPERNGDRTIADIAAHVDHDALLHWAWNPGKGREPAPYSLQETVATILAWGDAGAPCPGDE